MANSAAFCSNQVLYFTTKEKGGNILTSAFLKEVRRFELMVNDQLYATHFGNTGREYIELKGSALCGTLVAWANRPASPRSILGHLWPRPASSNDGRFLACRPHRAFLSVQEPL